GGPRADPIAARSARGRDRLGLPLAAGRAGVPRPRQRRPGHAAQGPGERRRRARRLRVRRRRRAARAGPGDRRDRHRPHQQGGAGRRGGAALGPHGDPRQALRHPGLRHAADGQGAARHPRHHARGAPARARPGHARARAAGDPPGPADDDEPRDRGAAHRRRRPQPARRRGGALRRRGTDLDHPRRRGRAEGRAAGVRPPARRHALLPRARGRVRHRGRHVPRPGPRAGEDPRLHLRREDEEVDGALGRQRHRGAAVPPRLGRPRHRVRSRVEGRGEPREHGRGHRGRGGDAQARMSPYTIAVIGGDGIGREVIREGVKVLEAVAGRGLALTFEEAEMGAELYRRTGEDLPRETFDLCQRTDAILFGAAGLPDVRFPDGTEIAPQVTLRFRLELYAGVRPIKLYPGVPSPLRLPAGRTIDYVIFRENTEGLFASRGGGAAVGREVAADTLIVTRKGTDRIARRAFEAALGRRRRLTCVDKSNVFRSYLFFREVVQEVGTEFPEVT